VFERFPRLRVAFFECSAEWINQYQQVVTHIYIMKVEQRGGRLVNAIVDRKGLIRYIHYGYSMSDIPDNETLLQVIEELNVSSDELCQ